MQLLCPHCHNPIEAVALDLAHETLCPSCGSTFRLDMGSIVTWPPSEGPGTLGPYELVGMVGTGELGSVHKAHDPELDRTVAIKRPQRWRPRSPTRWSTSKSTASSIARSSRRTSCSTSRASRNNRYFEMGRNQGTLRMRLRRCDLIPKSLMLTLHCLDPPR